jgi:3-deoxy-7-phosphoheptulonate synthase
VSRAAIAVGADGLIIEVHPCPERALSDGAQSLDIPAFEKVMAALTQPMRGVASFAEGVAAD